MRAAIYNPYWDTLGGGERYTVSVADILSRHGYKVDIAWKDTNLVKQIESRFGLKLSNTNIVTDINKGRDYDVCFWVSDGSIPLMYARKNLLHFQIPFTTNKSFSLLNRMKLSRINKVVCNSNFTKQFIDKNYAVSSIVLYPPVDTKKFKARKKENIILYVGRFSKLTQAKRQDVLVETFKKLFDSGQKDWKLVLAGGVEIGVGSYLDELKEQSAGYPISFVQSPNFHQLVELYGKAKIFWSAAGFGINEKKDPKAVEHFGITIVEAMAAKCLPLAYNAGGSKEIINDRENGFLWDTENDLLEQTNQIMKDKSLYMKLVDKAAIDSSLYSYEKFEEKLLSLL